MKERPTAFLFFLILVFAPVPVFALECVDYCINNGWQDFRGLVYAKNWYGAAEGKGYKTGSTPVVGAVLVWKSWDNNQAGHVAIVSSIVSDSEITVNHANWAPTAPYRMERNILILQSKMFLEEVGAASLFMVKANMMFMVLSTLNLSTVVIPSSSVPTSPR